MSDRKFVKEHSSGIHGYTQNVREEMKAAGFSASQTNRIIADRLGVVITAFAEYQNPKDCAAYFAKSHGALLKTAA